MANYENGHSFKIAYDNLIPSKLSNWLCEKKIYLILHNAFFLYCSDIFIRWIKINTCVYMSVGSVFSNKQLISRTNVPKLSTCNRLNFYRCACLVTDVFRIVVWLTLMVPKMWDVIMSRFWHAHLSRLWFVLLHISVGCNVYTKRPFL